MKKKIFITGGLGYIGIELAKELSRNYKVIVSDINIFQTKTNNISNLKNFKNKINLIKFDFKFKKPFEKISNKSSKYIEECFKISLDLMKKKRGFALINGPVSKKHLLKKKFPCTF